MYPTWSGIFGFVGRCPHFLSRGPRPMARIHSILASGVALLAALLAPAADAADDQALPWDGRFQDLTVDTLTDKYLTHILTMRQNGTVSPDQWVTVTQKGRSPAFNGDAGVATLAVDSRPSSAARPTSGAPSSCRTWPATRPAPPSSA